MKTTHFLILFATAQLLVAQPFTIRSYTIGAPGGTSSGKEATLKGTFGQYDAVDFGGRLSPFAIAGGFWNIAGAPQGPRLRIFPSGRTITVAWPEQSADFQLQETPQLSPPSWSNVNTTPRIVDGEKQVVLPLQPGPQFFRLQKLEVR